MANLKKVRQARIEKKYSKLIDQIIERMKDCTISELWVELDKLKEQMRQEFIKAGLLLENK